MNLHIKVLPLRWLVALTGGVFLFLSTPAAPHLSLETREVDIGDVIRGQTREAVFELHNDGDEPLIITDVVTGCACTVAEFDRTIAAGETGLLRATVDSTTLRGDVGRLLQLKTNDPADPSPRLTVRLNVLTSVYILPGNRVVMGNTRGLKKDQELLVLKTTDETGSLMIEDLESDNPAIEFEAVQFEKRTNTPFLGVAEAGDWLLRLRLRADATPGSANNTVRFRTGLAREPMVSVSVKTNVARPVNLVEDRVQLKRGAEHALSIPVMVRRNLDAASMQVQSPHDGLVVTAEPGEGRVWKLRLEAAAGTGLPAGTYPVVLRVGEESTSLMVEVD